VVGPGRGGQARRAGHPQPGLPGLSGIGENQQMLVGEFRRLLLDPEQGWPERNPARRIRGAAEKGDAALLGDGGQGEGFAADLERMRSRARTIPAEFVKQPVETEFADKRLKALGIVEEHGGSVRGMDMRF
jgi:hypothetical protein